MSQDAILRISAQVAGVNSIKSLSDGLQGLRRAGELSNAELGRMQIAVNRAAREAGNTVAGIKAHAAALDRLRDRTQIGSAAYDRLGREADALRGRLTQLTTAQEKLPRASANSLAGMSQQISRMQQLRQEVDLGTKRFDLYSAGIARLQAQMARATAAPANGMDWRTIGGAAGGTLAAGGGVQGALGGLAGGIAASGGVAGMAAGAGVLGAGALVANSTKAALEEYASLRRVRTLTADSDALMAKIRELTVAQGNLSNSAEAGAAAYEILSSGFSKTDDVIKILKASTLGATGGFSDIETVADGATSIMNSFNLSADKAARVVDQMVQTQNDGKIVVDQYAQSIGRLAPSFAVAGLSVEEMNAAISALTAKGAPVETTISGLSQTIKSIIKPTEEAKKLAAALGIEFNVAGLQAQGLGGFLQDVMVKTKGSATALGVLFSDIDGFKAVVSLTNDELKGYNKSLQNMDTLTGQAAKSATQAVDPVKQFSNAWKDFSANAGRAYLPALVKTLELMTKIIQADQQWRRLTDVGSMLDKSTEPKNVPYKTGSPIFTKGFTYLSPYSVAGVAGQFDPYSGALIQPTVPSAKGGKTDPSGARGNRMYAGTRPSDPATVGSGASKAGGRTGQQQGFQPSSRARALISAAGRLGVSPLDMATIISFETGGTFDPGKWGGSGNNYLGLIQMGGPERQKYGAHAGQSFEEQVQGPVVKYFQDRFQSRGMSTQGADLLTLYRTVLGGNPKASLTRKDGNGVTPASGVARMGPHRQKALQMFFGGSMENVGYDLAQAGADRVQGAEEAATLQRARADQLASARELLATNQGLLRVAEATTPAAKLLAEFDNARVERMREYAAKLAAAVSDDERSTLVRAQSAEAGRAELIYREDLRKVTEEQLELDRQRLDKLAELNNEYREIATRDSASAGFKQGMQEYYDSIGNLRDGISDLTVTGFKGLEDAAMSLATTGSTSFKAFASSILADASRMILRTLVLKTIMEAIGAITKSSISVSSAQGDSSSWGDFTPPASADYAAKGATFANGIAKFARGGAFTNSVVNRATLFKFASGGSFRTGVMGEATPEAIMPLMRDGQGRLGVSAKGVATGSTQVSIAVHVHPNGNVSSNSDGSGDARALGDNLARMLVPMVAPMVDRQLQLHMERGGLLNK